MGVNVSVTGTMIEEPPLWLRALLDGPPWGAHFRFGVCDECVVYGTDRYMSPLDGWVRCSPCYLAWFKAQPEIPVDASQGLRSDPVASISEWVSKSSTSDPKREISGSATPEPPGE